MHARSAWQIVMGRRHAPVIAPTRGFFRTSEGRTHHYRVGSGGEGFANLSAHVHAAVGNDRDVLAGFLKVEVASGRAVDRSGHLRDADPEDPARGAGRPRTHA